MNQIFAYFEPFPQSARKGIISLVAAWISFLFSLHKFYLPGEDWSRIMIIAAATCFVVARGYTWGRILGLLSNAMIVLLCLLFVMAYFYPPFVNMYGNHAAFGASLLNIVLFSASTVFLWAKESAVFYKTFRKKEAGD